MTYFYLKSPTLTFRRKKLFTETTEDPTIRVITDPRY